jgi:hypothetical protein
MFRFILVSSFYISLTRGLTIFFILLKNFLIVFSLQFLLLVL